MVSLATYTGWKRLISQCKQLGSSYKLPLYKSGYPTCRMVTGDQGNLQYLYRITHYNGEVL